MPNIIYKKFYLRSMLSIFEIFFQMGSIPDIWRLARANLISKREILINHLIGTYIGLLVLPVLVPN